jgi:NADPH:quinone reductase-like Zn-dependent oxidoreductase
VRVKAAGINFADLLARAGLYPDAPKPPCVVGYEFAGEVEGKADGLEPGQRVMGGCRFGGYSELVAAPAAQLLPLPDAWSFEQGAAFPVTYGTAYAVLLRYGGLRRGERVLVQAAAGGVGIAATQIAKRHGAEVYGTASAAKHGAIRAQGVDVAVDYRRPGWEKGLPRFDLIMDALGGPSFRRSYRLLNPGGRLVAFGASSVTSGEQRNLLVAARSALRMPRFNLIRQMSASKSVIGLNMLTLWDHAGTLKPWIDPLRALLDDGTIRPVVAEAVPFDRAPDAHRILAERRNVGKVVLVP